VEVVEDDDEVEDVGRVVDGVVGMKVLVEVDVTITTLPPLGEVEVFTGGGVVEVGGVELVVGVTGGGVLVVDGVVGVVGGNGVELVVGIDGVVIEVGVVDVVGGKIEVVEGVEVVTLVTVVVEEAKHKIVSHIASDI
jgi:hypothetical protein